MNLEKELFWKFKRLCLEERISMTDKLTKHIRNDVDAHDIKQFFRKKAEEDDDIHK